MEKLVHRIITHQSFAPGIKGGEYYYCDGIDREINQVMQEPIKKLYEYENQPDMREKVREYITELDVEIDRCHKKMEELSYDEICRRANKSEINYYLARREVLAQVKNDLQGRLDELDLKKYTIIATAEDITECQMILNNEQLETIVSVFKELDKNRLSDFCPWYEIEDEEGKMIYKTECI